MQIIVSLVLIFSIITSGLAAAYYGFYGDADHPGKCVINGLILSPGDVHYDLTKCEKTACQENNMAYFLSCGVYQPPDDCKLGEPKHPNALYPDCCEPHIICNTV